jgi:hypothetical protein
MGTKRILRQRGRLASILALAAVLGACSDDAIAGSVTGPDLDRPLLTASLDARGNASLSWSPVDGAISYRIERRDVSSAESFEDIVDNLDETDFIDNSVVAGTTYEYRVLANGPEGRATTSTPVELAV